MRVGVFFPPFGELADPRVVTELAVEAEAAGWDGFFLWDHVRYQPESIAIADPWVTLAAVAHVTERMRIGPLVTPLARRRPHKLARETVTLDHLSGGRVVLGVGLGSLRTGEFGPFGDPQDPHERAAALDHGLDLLAEYWAGQLEPRPVQRPRIPVWVASVWPNEAPLRRAARWDGWFPIGMSTPDQLASQLDEVARLRDDDLDGYDVVVRGDPGDDPGAWLAAGATWWLVALGIATRRADVEATIRGGPPAVS